MAARQFFSSLACVLFDLAPLRCDALARESCFVGCTLTRVFVGALARFRFHDARIGQCARTRVFFLIGQLPQDSASPRLSVASRCLRFRNELWRGGVRQCALGSFALLRRLRPRQHAGTLLFDNDRLCAAVTKALFDRRRLCLFQGQSLGGMRRSRRCIVRLTHSTPLSPAGTFSVADGADTAPRSRAGRKPPSRPASAVSLSEIRPDLRAACTTFSRPTAKLKSSLVRQSMMTGGHLLAAASSFRLPSGAPSAASTRAAGVILPESARVTLS